MDRFLFMLYYVRGIKRNIPKLGKCVGIYNNNQRGFYRCMHLQNITEEELNRRLLFECALTYDTTTKENIIVLYTGYVETEMPIFIDSYLKETTIDLLVKAHPLMGDLFNIALDNLIL